MELSALVQYRKLFETHRTPPPDDLFLPCCFCHAELSRSYREIADHAHHAAQLGAMEFDNVSAARLCRAAGAAGAGCAPLTAAAALVAAVGIYLRAGRSDAPVLAADAGPDAGAPLVIGLSPGGVSDAARAAVQHWAARTLACGDPVQVTAPPDAAAAAAAIEATIAAAAGCPITFERIGGRRGVITLARAG